MSDCNIKIFNFNLTTREQTLITADSENSLFPTSNLKDPRTTKEFRSQTDTLTASITFDMITIDEVDSIVIVGNAIEGLSFAGLVTIEANATDNWGAPAFSTTMTVDAKFQFGYKTFPVETYRFWRITISGGSKYVGLSNIFIGKSRWGSEIVNNVQYGWTMREKTLSKSTSNRYGQRFIDKIHSHQRELRFNMRLFTKDEMELIFDLIDENSDTEPVYVIVNEGGDIINDYERFSVYGYFKGIPTITNPAFSLYNFSFSIEEAT